MNSHRFVVLKKSAERRSSQTSAKEGMNFARRIRKACEQCNRPEEFPGWTTSIGVAEFHDDDDINDLQRRADQALYQSKKRGRNTTTLWEE